MLMAVVGRARPMRPRLRRRHAADRVATIFDDVSLGDRGAATSSRDEHVASRNTVRNSPDVNITVDEVEDDDDDDGSSSDGDLHSGAMTITRSTVRNSPEINSTVEEVVDDDDDNQRSSGGHSLSRDIDSTSSIVRNNSDVNITVDEVTDDDDDEQDGEETLLMPYTSSKTVSSDGTGSVGSVEYPEYATDPHAIGAIPSMDFVRKLDIATQHNVSTYRSPQSHQSHRITVHKKTWYFLETIEEVLSPMTEAVELPSTFAHALSLTPVPQTQQTYSLHKHYPLLVIKSIGAGDDMGELPLS